MRLPWRTPVVAVVLAAATVAGTSAHAATPAPAPNSSPSPTPTITLDPNGAAARLLREADRQAEQLARQVVSQQLADAKAAAALEAYQVAQRRSDEAARESIRQKLALADARESTERARETLAQYLGAVYRTGVGNRRLSVLSDLIDAEDPQALFTGLSMASRVGGNRNDQLAELRRLEAAQTDQTRRADAARTAAEAAATKAIAARAVAEKAVAEAKARVAQALALLTSTQQKADAAVRREAALAKAEIIARTRSAVPPLAALEGAAIVRPLADCKGGSTRGYPNGRIPSAVLCPLWGTSGHMLRADAAAAFNAMSKKYAETFEAPICVTDSYRSYEEQVAVKAVKPTLAATPGTSNHGWGVALDLCDGVQSFGTRQHVWLQENAMAFGWFHPSWAQAGGSLPEPWHWEFAG